jgi:hypothetical protein
MAFSYSMNRNAIHFHPFAGAALRGMNDFFQNIALFAQDPDLTPQPPDLLALFGRQAIGTLAAIQLAGALVQSRWLHLSQ